ncbi:MAG: hypothetical protein HQ513_06280, partial [Rhodospirillales bacterium]|nr:hypothetical protein [Rhodospirillales bacterium]
LGAAPNDIGKRAATMNPELPPVFIGFRMGHNIAPAFVISIRKATKEGGVSFYICVRVRENNYITLTNRQHFNIILILYKSMNVSREENHAFVK